MKYIDLNKLETSLTSAIKNVIALNADGEIIKAQFDPNEMGGGSVDNEEIESMKQDINDNYEMINTLWSVKLPEQQEQIDKLDDSVDAIEERLSQVDLIQNVQATIAGTLSNTLDAKTIKDITETSYSTDYVITTLAINGGQYNKSVRILSRNRMGNPVLPQANTWMIWGLYFDGTAMYAVSWTANGSMADDARVQATVTKIF